MVFVSPDFFGAMNDPAPNQIGYAFALPRVAARLVGGKPRRAEFSAWEAYGTGILVFGISCVAATRALLPHLGPVALQGLALLFLPVAIWWAFLFLYYVNALLSAGLRRLGLYSARTNTPFQHAVVMTLTTLLALHFLRDECDWVKSLGVLWLGILSLNLLAILFEKVRHES